MNHFIRKCFYFLPFLSLIIFFSCITEFQKEQPPVIVNTPLQSVYILKDENNRYENIRSRSLRSHVSEIKDILDRGYVVFAMHIEDHKPFFYKEEITGELIGLDVELAYAVANRMGVKAVFNRNNASFDDVITAVINGQADIALSKLSLTVRRAELVRFTNPYVTFKQALLVNRLEYAKIGTENQLSDFIKNFYGSIGVMADSLYQNYALDNFPNADIKTFKSWDDAVNALLKGDLLAVYHDEGEILMVDAKRKDTSVFLKPILLGDKRDHLAMAVAAGSPLLQEWLNVFLDEYLLQNGKDFYPAFFIERHFGDNR
ncbi:MAG: ABC transporter substrate-binding protein [Treponema sp.]|nr:ABC transporter substrate-binding protein [Treponema sp.]